ncbi:Frequenin-1,Neuronal calcium sensor 2,Hippocalcin-like protein 4,Neurocalcin homolog,Neurocalcin-delta,Neurocalcin,Neurocalcin-delta B,Visinin-like protein 1,Neurocalcin-delta A,Neuron-specific calcium-binding protein hippocalcin,Hippocalcin-like protein 1 [Lepeophtheirus salmonis]|uniref:EF-hand domain-containing protein n=1 Tax=Lepeophtheirus salmonis TaxID=72036 RepID=A0A7R8D0F2_LEPSM|nr:neuronal calcium sensor 2-like isoform X1 [Lepeophtheirus salmonis]CAB4067157.1 Frequenin-1,Neuronal calcium sensor 2,Hippocalcin-like protein 4,Neurocalcin homolog,Neurocalcin-delta,Neurocalcin,Neurocalcin-delta B,Visinin-like protein 1,Neurocalcin-delta A,Neuron-specific calcium-binding protein hippocalcin,Hippocalcin-like protein 1 [Lepeophtheirus salmonis]CAF2982893.1 Frequenin-1,Neuronal calcium sensor 2,Hippocalcin-like protein 4,Neurocalcin homolog,Neurocalcin-delta,Neurocalcin,Neurocal
MSEVGNNMSSRSGSRGPRYRNSRRHRQNKESIKALKQEDIDYLVQNTKYDESEIREWYKGFRADCPDGTLGKTKILDMYSLILPSGNAQVFVDQIFRIFDNDGNGTIDFKEFMMATDMTASGSPEEKLAWAFKMYDKDNSGSIELTEMIEIIGTLYEMEGVPREKAGDRAKIIFGALDVNGDGELTCEEFVRGCMEDPELVRLLNSGGLEEDNDEGEDEYEETDNQG